MKCDSNGEKRKPVNMGVNNAGFKLLKSSFFLDFVNVKFFYLVEIFS